jgi:predicted dienelactone hydrolase
VVLIKNIKSSLVSLVLSTSAVLFTVPAKAAERIKFNFPPFGQFDIEIEDLQNFVATREVSTELAYYLNRLPSDQRARLPELLSTPLELDPLSIAKFSNSTIGEALIKNFGKGIRADVNRNGFYALRGAIVAAAFDPKGLTVINLLDKFPLSTVYIDLKVLDRYVERGESLFRNRQAIDRAFFSVQPPSQLNYQKFIPESSQMRGKYVWLQQTFTYNNPQRTEEGYFDLYQPQTEQPVPLIVISHGLASNRQTFAYLAKHLASHGFAVAVIEHDEIGFEKFDNFLSGSERFPEPNNLIDRPLDVKYVLDRLESEINPQLGNKIDLQQVGAIGQSFGGYTSLALAGGQLAANKNAAECQEDNYQDVLLDLSSLAKCTFNELDRPLLQLRDPRIKAVIAINPLSKVFDKAGMSSIKIPTMLISGTNDLIMPPVAEQIFPFVWLNSEIDKYLVLVKPGTHFSFLQEGLGVLPVPDTVVGPSPTSAYPLLKALSTAFFKLHLAQQTEYQTYLQNNRSQQLEDNVFEWSLIRQLSPSQLREIIKR